MYTVTDRRIFNRIDGRLAVRYKWGDDGRERYASTINISGGGARLSLLERLSPGTILDMDISRLNFDGNSQCKGEVVWVKDVSEASRGRVGFEAGIRFIGLNLVFIKELIEDLGRYGLSLVT